MYTANFVDIDPSIEGEQGDAYNGDASGDKADLELPVSQKNFHEKIFALGKPIIFVNMKGCK